MEMIFPKNPVIEHMAYVNDVLSITFIKKGQRKVRQYQGCPQATAYAWAYQKSASDVLKFYANNIRKKFKLIKNTNQLKIKL